MEKKGTQSGFNGAAWFEQQVCKRTRAALNDRGITASTHSPEYKTEYLQQLRLFRAERAEVKQRKHEKYLARLAKKTTVAQTDANYQ